MKSLFVALALMIGVGSAWAVQPAAGESNVVQDTRPVTVQPFAGWSVGAYGSHQFHGASNAFGVIGTAPITPFLGVRAFAERSFPANQNRFGAEAQLNMPVTNWFSVNPHAGIAYVSNSKDSQFQPTAGVEGEFLLTKHNAVFVDYSYQRATGALGSLNGSRVSVGYRYLF